jgi:hypothetical protein
MLHPLCETQVPILWSLVFALAMVASAFLFKAHPALYWIEASLHCSGTRLCGAEDPSVPSSRFSLTVPLRSLYKLFVQ